LSLALPLDPSASLHQLLWQGDLPILKKRRAAENLPCYTTKLGDSPGLRKSAL